MNTENYKQYPLLFQNYLKAFEGTYFADKEAIGNGLISGIAATIGNTITITIGNDSELIFPNIQTLLVANFGNGKTTYRQNTEFTKYDKLPNIGYPIHPIMTPFKSIVTSARYQQGNAYYEYDGMFPLLFHRISASKQKFYDVGMSGKTNIYRYACDTKSIPNLCINILATTYPDAYKAMLKEKKQKNNFTKFLNFYYWEKTACYDHGKIDHTILKEITAIINSSINNLRGNIFNFTPTATALWLDYKDINTSESELLTKSKNKKIDFYPEAPNFALKIALILYIMTLPAKSPCKINEDIMQTAINYADKKLKQIYGFLALNIKY